MDGRPDNFHYLARKLDKAGVAEHYGDPRFPMQLQRFAEAVEGWTARGRGGGGVGGPDDRGDRGLRGGRLDLGHMQGRVGRGRAGW